MAAKPKRRKDARDTALENLRLEVRELRAAMEDVQEGRRLIEVKVSVTGPRRAGVLVDQQAIELPGTGRQAGVRRIELEPPNVDVLLGVKGRVGTKVAFEVEINGKSKKDEFWMVAEVERRPFVFAFSDFGL